MKYPPLTTAALVSYNNLGPFSEVVPAEKMAELERRNDELEMLYQQFLKELAEIDRLHNAYFL